MSLPALHSEFEQRRALQQFHDIADQAMIEQIADDLFIQKCESKGLLQFAELVEVFRNSSDDALDSFFIGAISRRDAQMVNMVANVMYDENQGQNPEYLAKLQDIAKGAKPALRAVN